jgi:hypothetical protein
LSRQFDVGDDAVSDREVDDNFVAAERVETLNPNGGWGQLPTVSRGPVVIENYFSVEIIE